MIESTITSKGQTTFPKEVRKALGLKPGDRVRYIVEGDHVRIARPRRLAELAGCLAGAHEGPAATLGEMDEAIAESAAERYRRAVKG